MEGDCYLDSVNISPMYLCLFELPTQGTYYNDAIRCKHYYTTTRSDDPSLLEFLLLINQTLIIDKIK